MHHVVEGLAECRHDLVAEVVSAGGYELARGRDQADRQVAILESAGKNRANHRTSSRGLLTPMVGLPERKRNGYSIFHRELEGQNREAGRGRLELGDRARHHGAAVRPHRRRHQARLEGPCVLPAATGRGADRDGAGGWRATPSLDRVLDAKVPLDVHRRGEGHRSGPRHGEGFPRDARRSHPPAHASRRVAPALVRADEVR